MLPAKGEDIGDQPHAFFWRKNIGTPGDVLFENVVLNGAFELIHRSALLFCCDHVHGQQHHGRCVDGHRRAHGIKRYTIEEEFHVFHGRNRHPNLPNFTVRQFIIGIHAELGGKVKRNRKAHLAAFEKDFEPLVCFFSTRKSSVLTHGPQTGPIHGFVDASCVRGLPCIGKGKPIRLRGC